MSRRLTVALAILFAVATFGSAGAQAQEDTSPDQELVERYAPIIAVRPQENQCDTTGEEFTPADANMVLDNPHVVLRQIGVGDPVLVVGPTSSDVFGMGGGFFIDFPGDAFDPGCLYEEDFQRYNGDRNAVVYAHVATQDDEPDKLAVQYWFFYYYNRYNNLHEGDWEGIQLMFDVGTIEEALQTSPTSIGYSQHFGGEVATWDEDKLEREDTHAVVYPALGSHASYFESALYLGRSGSQGFGCDTTISATRRLEPDVVLLPDRVDDPSDPLAWLMFEGMWGEKRFGPFSGATGPITKPRWTKPVDWHDTLRSSSVVVPDGPETTTPYVDGFCTVVGFGSRQYLTAQQHPFRISAIVGLLGLVAWFLLGRTQWNAVEPFPIIARRRLGQVITSSARMYWAHKWTLMMVAVLYAPLAIASTGLGGVVGWLTGPLGWFGSFLTGLVALVAQIVALALVSTAVIKILSSYDDDDESNDLSAADGYRYAFGRFREVAETSLRGAAIVAGLVITIVGIPWAIRQYVRYQMSTASLVLENQTPRGALHRSSEIIRGRRRWWHTAVAVVSLQLLIAGAGALAGLGLLILANGLPLGVYSAMTAIGGGLILPYLAITSAFLYGNAVAEDAGIEHESELAGG